MSKETKDVYSASQNNTVEPEIVTERAVMETAAGRNPLFRATAGALIWRGIVMLVFSVLLLVAPIRSIITLTVIIGAFLVSGGVWAFITAFRSGGAGSRELMIFNAAALTLLGLFSVVFPGRADVFWVLVVGFYQIFSGVQAFFCRGSRAATVWISGVISIVVGLVLISAPWAGLMTLTWLLALLLFAASLLTIITGIKLRQIGVPGR